MVSKKYQYWTIQRYIIFLKKNYTFKRNEKREKQRPVQSTEALKLRQPERACIYQNCSTG